MKRFARWLRLLVTCLAFVVTAAPAIAAEAFDQVVFVAEDEPRAESRAPRVAAQVAPTRAAAISAPPAYDSPRFVSRRWLVSCALLL